MEWFEMNRITLLFGWVEMVLCKEEMGCENDILVGIGEMKVWWG